MFAAMRYVRDHCRVDPIANHVAMVIATFVRRDGSAPVSVRQLADATGRHTKTVTLAVARLEAEGILKVARSLRRMNVYRFPVVDAVELSTAVTPRSAQFEVRGSRNLRAQSGKSARARRAHLDSEQLDRATRARFAAAHDHRDDYLAGLGWHWTPAGWIPPYTTSQEASGQ